MDLDAIGLAEARGILEPDLFDANFYRGEAGLGAEADAFAHYLAIGAAEALRANPVFDARWYVERNPGVPLARALLHYARVGESEGRDPSALFDVGWYRARHGVERPLAHYLKHRFGAFSPVPEFDAAFYLAQYPDVAATRLDPFLHYLHFGFREFRKPRAGFNPRLYAMREMGGDFTLNPVAHARSILARRRTLPPQAESAPQTAALPPDRSSPQRAGPYEEARRFKRRGPRFEARDLAEGEPRALLLAFHLPQFHRVAENDAWWGEGFTEWTQLARGTARFAGHYQPRIPGSLGFYDLTNVEALRAQAELARAGGIGAFVFYHYDFDGRRLLEKPVDLFLATPDIDMPFCLMWANENWTRRWDGAEQEVLIAQSYDPAYEAARIEGFVRHFRDPRYLRLEGRPLLMVYRAGLIPDGAEALARWRALFAQRGENPILVMAQTFDDLDPRPLGYDAAIEFPPHKLTKGLPQVYAALDIFDEGFEADAFAYEDLADAALSAPAPEYPLIRTAAPSWDNDARRDGKGLTLVGSTPRAYELWLSELIARATPMFGARLVGVNAWNEWSEGAYLEPDVHFGHAYLNATSRAVRGIAPPKTKVTLTGEAGRRCAAAFGVECLPSAALAGRGPSPHSPSQDGLWGEGPQRRDEGGLHRAEGRERPPHPNPLPRGERGPLAAALNPDSDPGVLFDAALPGAAKVSVFVVHRAGAFAPERLRSLFAQTHPAFEIVVLDAGESAVETVEAEAVAAGRDVTLGLDVADPLRQAAQMAGGEFVWLLEAEGRSDETALAALARALRSEPDAAFALCLVGALDAAGRRVRARRAPLAGAERGPAVADGVYAGSEFLALLAQGPAPTLGAALWRREALRAALADPLVDEARLLARAASAPGARVAVVAERLEFSSAEL